MAAPWRIAAYAQGGRKAEPRGRAKEVVGRRHRYARPIGHHAGRIIARDQKVAALHGDSFDAWSPAAAPMPSIIPAQTASIEAVSQDENVLEGVQIFAHPHRSDFRSDFRQLRDVGAIRRVRIAANSL